MPLSVADDHFGAVALEIDRLYDRMHREVPSAALPGTTTGIWLDEWADEVGLERLDAAPASGQVKFTTDVARATPLTVAPGFVVATVAASDDAVEVTFQTVAAVTVPAAGGNATADVIAVQAGPEGNVATNTVTVMVSESTGLAAVTNPLPVTGGTDIEPDDRLQKRVLRKLRGAGGPGNVDDYVAWGALNASVGPVKVDPNWNGPGTVRVWLTDHNNDPVSALVVAERQQAIDPPGAPGAGYGLAPIGATVTVAAPGVLTVAAPLTVRFLAGFSLDGAGGTVALRTEIVAALSGYIDALRVGEDVTRNKVVAAVVDIEGVDDVTALTLNGGSTGDLVVAATSVAAFDRAASTLTAA